MNLGIILLPSIKAVVFDLDNTLVSSSLNFPLIKLQLGCDKNMDLLTFLETLPTEEQTNAHQHIINHELQDAHSATVLDGCHSLLETLKQQNLFTAIVTRNCNQAAEIKVQNNKINIPIVLTREDHAAKPSPDALIHLSKHWQIKPEEILYVGDYLFDIQTAKNANSLSCLVCRSNVPDYANLADIVVRSLNELELLITNTMEFNSTSKVSV